MDIFNTIMIIDFEMESGIHDDNDEDCTYAEYEEAD